jgi:hypothetical protein
VNAVMNFRGFHKLLGNYRVATQLVASRVALSSTQLLSYRSTASSNSGRMIRMIDRIVGKFQASSLGEVNSYFFAAFLSC